MMVAGKRLGYGSERTPLDRAVGDGEPRGRACMRQAGGASCRPELEGRVCVRVGVRARWTLLTRAAACGPGRLTRTTAG